MFRSTGPLAPHALKFRPHLLALLAVGLTGCAQMQQAGYYNPPPASTTTDAIAQGEGIYNNQTLRAPSQIQISLQQPGTAPRTAATSTVAPSAIAANPRAAAPGQVAGTNVTSGAPTTAPTYDSSKAPVDAPPSNAGSTVDSSTSRKPASHSDPRTSKLCRHLALLSSRNEMFSTARDHHTGAQWPVARTRNLPRAKQQEQCRANRSGLLASIGSSRPSRGAAKQPR